MSRSPLIYLLALGLLSFITTTHALPAPPPIGKQHHIPRMSYETPYQFTGTIFRVIDGDTFVGNVTTQNDYLHLKAEAQRGSPKQVKDRLRYFNDTHRAIRVRIDFIDTSESVHRDTTRNTQAGVEASAFLKTIAEKKVANLSCYGFERHGRMICSASLGQRDIGLIMLREGHAQYTRQFGKHPTHDLDYLDAQAQGKRRQDREKR